MIISGCDTKASSAIKIDIVKPILPSIDAPIMCFMLVSFGNEHRPKRMASHEAPVIPTNLPNSKPNTTPRVIG